MKTFAVVAVTAVLGTAIPCAAQTEIPVRKEKEMNIEVFEIKTAEKNLFTPAITVRQDGRWVLVAQPNLGTDFGGEPCYSISRDQGKSWSEFRHIEPFVTQQLGDGVFENMADVRPYVFGEHPEIFFFGCTILCNKKGNLSWQQSELPPTKSRCAILHPDDSWSIQELELPVVSNDVRSACIQADMASDDEIIVPFHFVNGISDNYFASVATVRYRIENSGLVFDGMGNILELQAGRGLLEPSVIRLADGRFAMTLRAEDNNGYCTVSDDGLLWEEIKPWRFDDGSELVMSTTQQHWMRLGEKVFLLYTRKAPETQNVFRYRSAVFAAEAIPDKALLKKDTEKMVLAPQTRHNAVGLLGNFHVAQIDDNSAVVTDAYLFEYTSERLFGENGAETQITAAVITAE